MRERVHFILGSRFTWDTEKMPFKKFPLSLSLISEDRESKNKFIKQLSIRCVNLLCDFMPSSIFSSQNYKIAPYLSLSLFFFDKTA